jgi:hypothetical protein
MGCSHAINLVQGDLSEPVQLDLISSHVSGSHVFLNYKVQK